MIGSMNEDQIFQEPDWYLKSSSYWENVSPDIDGMLGGLGHLHQIDIKASGEFLDSVIQSSEAKTSAVIDCGAGIGRISFHLLSNRFSVVDLCEKNKVFLEKAQRMVSEKVEVKHCYCCGLEDFNPPTESYKVIWAQWVLNYLKDDDLVSFLKRSREAVKSQKGFIIIKENISRSENYIYDEDDSSVTRSDFIFKSCFREAGCVVVKEQLQPDFPSRLFPVKMYALVPFEN